MSESSDIWFAMATDDVYSALANPVRRRLLELLAVAPRNAGALAAEFDRSRPAISEHLQVLRRASLVSEEVRGREHIYQLTAEPLAAVDDWLRPFERYWRDRLTALAEHLEETPEP
jgi:DNA-binding transcriptional ArsR family regulator